MHIVWVRCHTLLWPIARNSILLLRPNHQILFPGNFYPFMSLRRRVCACANVDESKADRRTADRGMKKGGEEKKNPVLLAIRFRLFSPVS